MVGEEEESGGVAEFMVWEDEAAGGADIEFMETEVVDVGSVHNWVEIPKSFLFLDHLHGFF